MSDWYPAGMEDDMRPRMFEAAGRGRPFALVTIVAAEGGGPRGVGAQMVVTADDMGGFLSGGCIEADVALHARECLVDGEPRRLVYGRGSPFVDARLPCGGRLELLALDDLPPTLRPILAQLQPGQTTPPLPVEGAVVIFYLRDAQGTVLYTRELSPEG